jgi:uncharacterized membrane protein YbhN (UPF0104 family)
MGNVPLAVGFAIFATALEIALAFFGLPIFLLVAVALALIAADLLLISWHPLALTTSVSIYLAAVVVGIVGFSWLELASQVI